MNLTLVKAMLVLVPAFMLVFWLSRLVRERKGAVLSPQLFVAGCMVSAPITHVSEAFHLFHRMHWGLEHGVRHYLALCSAVFGLTLFRIRYVLNALAKDMSNKLPQRGWGISPGGFLAGWWNVLNGRAPLLSIEITRECPLNCPGCYAYGEQHLGVGAPTLREVRDFRGEALINGILQLVRKHRPVHVSLVGGEPMVRWKELDQVLPTLGQMGIHTLLVTSAVIPIPREWMKIPRLRVAVSIDGLPEHHDVRRKPATYERILQNIRDCTVNVHWTITRPMLGRPGYLEEYVAFWSGRDEVNRIWASIYSPQVGEHSTEMLTPDDRHALAEQLPRLGKRYPKFLMNEEIAAAFLEPPQTPGECLFSRMSLNCTADLKTRIEPCVLGGAPDCAQCGCAASIGLHGVKSVKVAGPLRVGDVLGASIRIGQAVGRIRGTVAPRRWQTCPDQEKNESVLVQLRTPRG